VQLTARAAASVETKAPCTVRAAGFKRARYFPTRVEVALGGKCRGLGTCVMPQCGLVWALKNSKSSHAMPSTIAGVWHHPPVTDFTAQDT
jgi:hypothetical protein